MVALAALFVALVAAALAAYAVFFLKTIEKKIPPPISEKFYPPAAQSSSVFLPEIQSELDIVGAWALEEEQAGRGVSAEAINLQRLMRLEAGL